jgi:hypothetical protein
MFTYQMRLNQHIIVEPSLKNHELHEYKQPNIRKIIWRKFVNSWHQLFRADSFIIK